MLLPFRVNLLGPVEARTGDTAALLGHRERAVMALLALHGGSVVPVTRVIDELWPDGPPHTAGNVVQGIVSRLRRSLGPDAVRTVGAGYALNRSRVGTDLDEFERLAASGRSVLADRPADAAQQLRQALALWHGEPLSDLQNLGFARMETVRLHERRMLVVEDRIAADLASGAGPMILDELADLERRHPFREGLVANRVRALAQAGRRVEALDAYAAFRRRLVDETGLEPTAGLRELHQALLDDDAEASRRPQPATTSTAGDATGERVGKIELPSGTVTLLVSDIDGATALLSRVGPAYADALDGQRWILRKAWAEHGGIVLGNEGGDGFSVVFDTAPAAVAAAVQAQRELAGFDWPAGEPVRVRIGIHTGNPTVRDGAYVGMDVHRAAKIGAAAHGGQVVLSSAAAELATGSLPDGVRLRDLGSHQLKDIPRPEHLLQLTIDGLDTDFGPLRTLGTTSSLPRPATQLVGRDDELAQLTTLLGSPQVRLVTLTGPGGTGKTRLAIAVVERLVQRFPDGVYFVDLATTSSVEVMWTSIAEALDVPPEGRIPPGFFSHIAHRTALLLLDNLEQLAGADEVVAELLQQAPQVVVVATSRRPLNVPGELQHAVPPLGLPDHGDTVTAAGSGAVQLFLQTARSVRSGFAVTADNLADVVAVCSRLDGLPLAIELAAARSKLLAPPALLARLDMALDMKASGAGRPTRQQTLRDTIAWSYDLLSPIQQQLFRRLGVFAGGADLDAIETITADALGGADVLNLVADLVDASLATIGESTDGEPRIGMLETIRAFALDQLAATDEGANAAQRDHAEHYATVIDELEPLLSRGVARVLQARSKFELDHDNIREVLRWALVVDPSQPHPVERLQLGLRICSQLWRFWYEGGYYAEGRAWLERVIEAVEAQETKELAVCLDGLSSICRTQGDTKAACAASTQAVAVAHRLDKSFLPIALGGLGIARLMAGEQATGIRALEEAVTAARELDDPQELAGALGNLGRAQMLEGNYERAFDLTGAAVALHAEVGDEFEVLRGRHNLACILRLMGRWGDAYQSMHQLIPSIVRSATPAFLVAVAEDFSCVLVGLGRHELAAHLLGAADAMRERNRTPRDLGQESEIAEPLANARAALSTEEWEAAYASGANMTVENALHDALTAKLPDRPTLA